MKNASADMRSKSTQKPVSGMPRRCIHPLTAASFRTWRGWAAHTRTVPDTGNYMVLRWIRLVKVLF